MRRNKLIISNLKQLRNNEK